MMHRTLVAALLCAALALPGHADSLFLFNGARIDGKVSDGPDGVLLVETGGRRVFIRPDEIERHEKNDLDGRLDMDKVRAEVAETLAEMERRTGLSLEQRNRVDEALNALQGTEGAQRLQARDRLIALHGELNILRYVAYLFDQLITPTLLDAVYYLSPGDAVPYLQRGVQHANYQCRAHGIELLASIPHRESADLIARGLADHRMEVRLAATYAMAQLGAKKASLALVEQLSQPDVKISNASQQALEALWASEIGGEKPPRAVSEWKAFLDGRSLGGAFQLTELEPLILPEEEFVIG